MSIITIYVLYMIYKSVVYDRDSPMTLLPRADSGAGCAGSHQMLLLLLL